MTAWRVAVDAGPKLKFKSSSVLRGMGDPSAGGSHGRFAGCSVACQKPSSVKAWVHDLRMGSRDVNLGTLRALHIRSRLLCMHRS